MKKAAIIFGLFLFIILFVAILTVISRASFGIFGAPRSSIYGSSDRGEHWFALTEEDVVIPDENNSRLVGAEVSTIVFHKEAPEIIYAGTDGSGLWKSIDGGSHWHQVLDQEGVLHPDAVIQSIESLSFTTNAEEGIREEFLVSVFQDDYGRILHTTDGGAHFDERFVTSKEGSGVQFIDLDPTSRNVVWAGTGESIIVRSTDRGITWHKIGEMRGLPLGIVPLSGSSAHLLAPTLKNGLQESLDGGKSWRRKSRLNGEIRGISQIISFHYDPRTAHLYLGTEEGLVESTDG